MNKKISLVILFCFWGPAFSLAQPPALKPIIKKMEAENSWVRRQASKRLALAIEQPASMPLVNVLIRSLNEKNYRLQLGITNALSRLESFWISSEQTKDQERLYQLYLQTDDPTLKKTIDRALMRSQGLYYDAIRDYHDDVIDDAVNQKFRYVFLKYPLSSYAPMSHFYLGRYHTRRTFMQEPSENQRQILLEDAEKIYNEFFDNFENYQKTNKIIADVYFFRALNLVLLNQSQKAIEVLKHGSSCVDQSIYINQFYYTRKHSEVVDNYLNTAELSAYVQTFLETNQLNFENQLNLQKFIDYLLSYRKN